ncbi:cell division protein FtsA [Actinobacillus delphinicola]|uniref:Cell division protein FtsA n=1 Tax=Actinobacillus delphinicola TaxID=51161 RepID=A0A448TUC6_9PAST|nr:cell division protein FtsA [Actinobacillus delphinicola]MDG6897720.1 cell division protein FtsA [Actinobacillus delphinicola]VEJ09602.1 cell division protein FtsA [Actinobacillus delphinicola]
MKNNGEQKLIVGLEIGTSKVAAVVGQVFPNGMIEVSGFSSHPSKGISQGGITDLNAIANAIQRAIESAADVAHCQIESVIISITGKHIHSLNESGVVAIGEDEEVTQEDIDQAVMTARSVKIGDGLSLLQVIPQEFALDDRMNITDPLGLQGMRLTARAHLIACQQAALANLKKAVGLCHSKLNIPLQVDRVFYSGYASAEAVLTEDEKNLGVCVIDFGAGTMDIAVYTQGKLRLSKSLTYAGNRVTNDITHYFSTPFHEAEEIKIQYGSAMYPPRTQQNAEIKIKSATPGRVLTCDKSELSEIIAPRYFELLNLVKTELNKLKEELDSKKINSELISGIVITGGAALTQDLVQCAEIVFQCPVRIGYPIDVSGMTDYVNNPAYSTAIGLLRCYQNQDTGIEDKDEDSLSKKLYFKLKKFVNKVRSEF